MLSCLLNYKNLTSYHPSHCVDQFSTHVASTFSEENYAHFCEVAFHHQLNQTEHHRLQHSLSMIIVEWQYFVLVLETFCKVSKPFYSNFDFLAPKQIYLRSKSLNTHPAGILKTTFSEILALDFEKRLP